MNAVRCTVTGARRQFVRVYFVLVMVALGTVTSFATPEPPTLPTIDVQPLFDGIATYLPWVFAILAVPTGLVLAFALARFIINAFINAFKGGKV